MALAERDGQLDFLRRLLADASAAYGRVAMVTGPVASGKTELLHVFGEHARGAGALVLTATGTRAERNMPLGVLRQLLRGAALAPETLARVLALLDEGQATATRTEPDNEVTERVQARIAHDLADTLLALSAESVLVLTVDDVDHADVASVRVLVDLARRLRSHRVLVLFTELTGASPAHPAFRTELLRQPHFRRIRLTPLSVRGVAEMLEQQLAGAAHLAADCHELTGGNPLLVRALVEDQHSAPAHGGLSVGEAFGQAVLACLHRGNPLLLRVAQGVAVLGSTEAEPLSGLLDLTPEAVTQGVDTLVEAGLARRGGFRHPAVGAAVLADVSPDSRAELHLRAAERLHLEGAPPPPIAEHLLAAGRIGGQWAVQVLWTAGEHALTEDRVEYAVECLELAHRSSTDDQTRATIRMMLVGLARRANPAVVARHLAELTEALRKGTLNTRDALTSVRCLLLHGRNAEAAQALVQLSETVGQTDKQTALELAITREWMFSMHPPLLSQLPAAELAPESGAVRDPRLQTGLALRKVIAVGPEETAIMDAEQVLQGSRLSEKTFDALVSALMVLYFADRLDRALPWADALLAESAERNAPGWHAMFASVRAALALRQGDLPGAEQHARTALRHTTPHTWGVAVGGPLGCLIVALTELGKLAEAEELLNLPTPDAMLESTFGLQYLSARGRCHLAADRLYAALGDFRLCGELMAEWGMDRPSFVPWRSDAAEVLIRLGKQHEARALLEVQLAMDCTNRPRIRGVTLRLLAAISEPHRRLALLTEAVELSRAGGDRLQLARALGELSQAQVEVDSTQARMTLRRAWHLARECQAAPLCEELVPGQAGVEAEAPPAPVEVDADKVTALSDAEQRVAALAAQGHTNRQIASKLCITISTVEQHLTRVYKKLNVTRRADLPSGLHSPDTAVSA
ncbi:MULTISPECIES: LuxR family transcriptional regulator [unclassified Crossiella]|uniref:helix-turn-helix transcriptional regulator n=1 Tax=unclassified Crossiella TaxID=2620835 RepID=UPI00249547A5|nr:MULTISPECIES: LuxR family transcriptional regulator [unclassified Crossiella]